MLLYNLCVLSLSSRKSWEKPGMTCWWRPGVLIVQGSRCHHCTKLQMTQLRRKIESEPNLPDFGGFKMLMFPKNFQGVTKSPVASCCINLSWGKFCIQPLRSTQTGSASVWDLEVGRMGNFTGIFVGGIEGFFFTMTLWLIDSIKIVDSQKKIHGFSMQPSEYSPIGWQP